MSSNFIAISAALLALACNLPEKNVGDAGVDAGSVDESILIIDGGAPSATEVECARSGWNRITTIVAGQPRRLLWNAPTGAWTKGALIVLHGGGGKADDFCTGGTLVQPQIAFASQAVMRGFAVFLLDSTDNVVTDAEGRRCGKRFDFSVLPRANVDLPYIEWVGQRLIPYLRPSGSSASRFITGLSTGGYMTIRAGTHFDSWVTAFAPVSAGDPYGTDTICDSSLSMRESAVGILVDRETKLEIVKDDACVSTAGYPNESEWNGSATTKPAVKQFHDRHDGVVDFSCMQKATSQLSAHGYDVRPAFLLETPPGKELMWHLWRLSYNAPLIEFFESFSN